MSQSALAFDPLQPLLSAMLDGELLEEQVGNCARCSVAIRWPSDGTCGKSPCIPCCNGLTRRRR